MSTPTTAVIRSGNPSSRVRVLPLKVQAAVVGGATVVVGADVVGWLVAGEVVGGAVEAGPVVAGAVVAGAVVAGAVVEGSVVTVAAVVLGPDVVVELPSPTQAEPASVSTSRRGRVVRMAPPWSEGEPIVAHGTCLRSSPDVLQ
jgi:hypothetical protein